MRVGTRGEMQGSLPHVEIKRTVECRVMKNAGIDKAPAWRGLVTYGRRRQLNGNA